MLTNIKLKYLTFAFQDFAVQLLLIENDLFFAGFRGLVPGLLGNIFIGTGEADTSLNVGV
jgi:hypothetical protein